MRSAGTGILNRDHVPAQPDWARVSRREIIVSLAKVGPAVAVADSKVSVCLGLFDACHRPQECECAIALRWQASNNPKRFATIAVR